MFLNHRERSGIRHCTLCHNVFVCGETERVLEITQPGTAQVEPGTFSSNISLLAKTKMQIKCSEGRSPFA